jgi:TDG/mug DNA glycosylase family protein
VPGEGGRGAATRPTAADLAAAADRTLPDVLADGLTVVFCGINPGLWSAATGHHFARPGNRFWPVLHRAGFTPHQLRPHEQDELLCHRLGVTNLAARATAGADELTAAELAYGAQRLAERVARHRPAWLAVLGVGAYRLATGDRGAGVGPQPGPFAGTRVWLLPNPSGLNAYYQLDRLTYEFARLRQAVD